MTQNQRLLEHLQTGRSINPLQAWRVLGIYRLSGRIFDLRKAGHKITSERKTVFNRFGEDVVVANYKLDQ